ncbi:MAG: AEC family transporter [Anaerolineales bacterium]
MLDILVNVIGPVFIIVGVVALAGRRLEIDTRALSTAIVYLMGPALILDGIANAALDAEALAQVGAMAVGVALIMGGIGWGVARVMGLSAPQESALIISLMLVNAANYGIPVNRFAFGDAAEDFAVVYYALSATVVVAVAIFVGAQGKDGARAALRQVLTVPLSYAGFIGLGLSLTDTALPLPIERAVGVLADGAVPAMLVVLGLSLSRLRLDSDPRLVGVGVALRLIVGPVVALGLATLLGVDGLLRQVTVVQSSMPTAVLASVIVAEFGGDAPLTSAIILASTLVSILTLSVVIAVV